MKIQEQKTLKVKLKGDDIELFKGLIKKLNAAANQVGFKNNAFTDKENELIKSLEKKV